MQAYELNVNVPANHQITLPAELPTGSLARVIILLEEPQTVPTAGSPEAVLSYLEKLKNRRQQRTSERTQEEIEASIQECRNDWDD